MSLRLLNIEQVVEKVNISKPTIYNWIKSGYFPSSVLFGNGKRQLARWNEEEIDDWIKQHYTQPRAS
ncbi:MULTISPECIES: helix-turn-helix transcriptional regulator [unclassified Acinetobacter]|uniref:helix-turn-helix transcriptional regulator n=1 Tax=unclassified Acinetobacter TaxID=196816 RepID=UPI0029350999|nr:MULTISPECIES: helix-turn-helix domain-containing protein [unclassified Acinetobacter]WOE32793.1 AlpA family phage regulatory protein [Acinetobacter sp. SAAs470]WOE38270.1 AlpA family phage regulatory protein [Acinetobacter sp. SAAs474]